MKVFRNTIICMLLALQVLGANAQNNTNSPYTLLGFGELYHQVGLNSVGMGGTSIGVRDRYHINMSNPASYSSVDSITFMFDGGLSLQMMNIYNGTNKFKAKNSSFDYLSMQFRLMRGLGLSLGVYQYANVGYSFGRNDLIRKETNSGYSSVEYSRDFYGEGGIRQMYLGLGYNLLKGLSVGANISYIWGDISRTSETYANSIVGYRYKQTYETSLSDYKLDFGAQYTYSIKKNERVTIGLTYSNKKELNSNVELTTLSSNSLNERVKPKTYLPETFGAGISYTKDYKLMLAADYRLSRWKDANSSIQTSNIDFNKSYSEAYSFADVQRMSVGAEYIPNANSNGYLANVKYRVGAYYSTPYYTLKGQRALNEYGVSFGLGLPLPRNKSIVNIAAQYVHQKSTNTNFDSQNIFKLSLGITFSETWFFKRRVD